MKKASIDVGKIRTYMWQNKLTKKAFCEKCGISFVVLNKILNNQSNFYISSLFKVAKVLNVELYQMFVER